MGDDLIYRQGFVSNSNSQLGDKISMMLIQEDKDKVRFDQGGKWKEKSVL